VGYARYFDLLIKKTGSSVKHTINPFPYNWYTEIEMKTKNKKKKTALFYRDKPNRQVPSGQYQFQAQDSTGIVIRRRRGKQDKRICFSKQGES